MNPATSPRTVPDDLPQSSLRYQSLADELRGELLVGKFRAGDRFPSIRAIITKNGRSLPTVRSALNLLVAEGLLQRLPRSGYFVTPLGARQAMHKGLRLVVVTPAFSAPTEPWFTGRIISGIVNAAAQNDVRVSIIQRRVPPDARMTSHPDDIERIKAEEPDGLVWLHLGTGEDSILDQITQNSVPVITTMRSWLSRRSSLVREDDWMFALQVVTAFQALGHRAIGIVLHKLEDEYYASKFACLCEIAIRAGIQIDRTTCFIIKDSLVLDIDKVAAQLDQFLVDRPQITGLLVLDSNGLLAVGKLWNSAATHPVRRLSLLLNVLDGDNIPTYPLAREIATITPPLELMGERIVAELIHRINGTALPKYNPLIPQLRFGKTMLPAP